MSNEVIKDAVRDALRWGCGRFANAVPSEYFSDASEQGSVETFTYDTKNFAWLPGNGGGGHACKIAK